MPDWYNPQDLNRYTYVRNNPIIRTDPTGHVGPVVAAVAGFATSPAGLLAIGGAAVITYESYELGWGPNAAQNRQNLINAIEALDGYIFGKKWDGTPTPVFPPEPPPSLPNDTPPLDSDVFSFGRLPPGPIKDFLKIIGAAYIVARALSPFTSGTEIGDAPYPPSPPAPPGKKPANPCGEFAACIRDPFPNPCGNAGSCIRSPEPGWEMRVDDPQWIPY